MGRWAAERTLAYQTTLKMLTEETPFSLVYSSEAIIPTETSVPIARYQFALKEDNIEKLSHELDLLDEKKELAFIQTATYKQKIT